MVGLVGLLTLSPSLLAAPRDVIADYFKDGRIDYGYSVQDLRGALVFARGGQGSGPQYAAFADAVNQAITDGLVGSGEAAQEQLTTPRSRTEVAPPPAPMPEPAAERQPGRIHPMGRPDHGHRRRHPRAGRHRFVRLATSAALGVLHAHVVNTADRRPVPDPDTESLLMEVLHLGGVLLVTRGATPVPRGRAPSCP